MLERASRLPISARHAAKLSLLLTLALAGCVYRIDIQQGNFLEPEEVDQVTVGMTRSQVRYLLGTPMVDDPFDETRWDYVYFFKKGRSRKAEYRHFIVHFDGDRVVRIERSDTSRPS